MIPKLSVLVSLMPSPVLIVWKLKELAITKPRAGAVDIRIIVSRSILKLCSIYDENVSTGQENFVNGVNDLNLNKGGTKLVRLT